MSPKRNRKGQNSRRRKRTLLKKAHEYTKLSGADIAFFIHKFGHWYTYKSTDRQSFPPSWEQIVRFVAKYIHNADREIANVISTPGKSTTTGFPTSTAGLCLHLPKSNSLSGRHPPSSTSQARCLLSAWIRTDCLIRKLPK